MTIRWINTPVLMGCQGENCLPKLALFSGKNKDLHLKCGTAKENSKNNITGRKFRFGPPHFPQNRHPPD